MRVIVQDLKYAPQPQGPEIIRGVSFSVSQGELCTLVGPSGSGKSTLLQLIAGLLKPTGGSVRFQKSVQESNGASIHRPANHRMSMHRPAIVFQYPERHFFNVTVYDELAFGLRRFGLGRAEIDERIDESLNVTGAFSSGLSQSEREAFLGRSPFSLSGGEQRAVAIAVALVLRPALLLLDEPTAGLDPSKRRQFFELLDAWRKRHGVTTILVSHDLSELSTRSDRVLALNEGRIAYDGLPADFFYDEDLLHSLGLMAPPVPELVQRLYDRGIALGRRILHVEEAVNAIAEAARLQRGEDGSSETAAETGSAGSTTGEDENGH